MALTSFHDGFAEAKLRRVPDRQPLSHKVGKALGKFFGRLVEPLSRYTLPVLGLSSISYAGFLVHIALGMLAVGVSCFILDWGKRS